MPDAEAMLASLPSLSAADLRALHDRAAVLLSIGGGARQQGKAAKLTADTFSSTLYDALTAELQQRTRASSAPYAVFLRTGAGKRYEQAAVLAQTAHERWYRSVTKAALISMCRMYAELIFDYLASCSLPAVWDTVSWAVQSLPVIVDQAYPGYAERGLLEKVHTLRTRGGSAMK